MKKEKIQLIVVLMGIVVVGLIALQLYWVKNALLVQEQYFTDKVNQAMDEVVHKLDKQQIAKLFTKQLKNLIPQTRIVLKSSEGNSSYSVNRNGIHIEGNIKVENGNGLSIVERQGKHYSNSNGKRKSATDFFNIRKQFILRNFSDVDGDMKGPFEVEDNNVLKAVFDSMTNIANRADVLQSIIMDMAFADKEDILESISPHSLDSLIRESLENQDVKIDYQWGIYNDVTGRFYMANAHQDLKALAASPYKAILFPTSLYPRPDFLAIHFPNKNHFLFKRMGFVLASSAGLILLVIFCFGYTIYTILRQKKLSDMKTDFINNMTHEFKTPVATITLASEALKDPTIVADKERTQRLASIIYDENKRIGSHVERVLQLAAMEKGSFKLNPVEVDMHRLINNVVESVSLQVEAHGGQITCKLDAVNPLFKADELHFSNVLYNLLDNAIKYCKEAPEIQISTINRNNQLVVTIDDNGIGLTKEQQARVFEQFYRVPTGNLHDVKGFGLGLHYVKSVVEMHGGTVRVKSDKEKGSSFEITLNQ